MLYLTLEGLGRSPTPLWNVTGRIGRIRSGRLADYRVELSERAEDEVSRGTLLSQPRWAESVLALCARGVFAATVGRQACGCDGLGQAFRFSLSVHLRKELLRRVPAALLDPAHLAMTAGRRFPLQEMPRCRWGMARCMLSFAAFGSLDHPSVPAPLDTPVYTSFDDVRYCRIKDLPSEAAAVFRQQFDGAAAPAGAGVPYDAVFPWDMERFLGAAEP